MMDEPYDAVTSVLPTTGLIGKFMELTDVGQICPRYRFFVLMAVLGSIVNRKVFIQRGSRETFPPLYMNPWIVLLGPQGRGNKTSAVNLGRRLLEALPEEYKPRIFSSRITVEALIKSLSSLPTVENLPDSVMRLARKKAIGTFIITELGVLFGREKYLSGLPMVLTELYDCHDEWASETVMRGNEKLYEVCLTMLAASTPDWMQKLLPKDAFEIGFMSRLILVPLPKNWLLRRIPLESNKQLYNEILDELVDLAKVEGEMVLTIDAWDAYRDWYFDLPVVPPGPMAEYMERKQDHVLKIAGLLQLAQTRSKTLTSEYFHLALSILDSIEPDVEDLISYISTEPKMKIVKKILELITFNKEMMESDLISEVWSFLSTPREFEEVIQLLIRMRKIEWAQKDGMIVYRWRDSKED